MAEQYLSRCCAAVAVVDLQGKGAHAVELVEVVQGPANLAGRRIVIARGNMLMDAVSIYQTFLSWHLPTLAQYLASLALAQYLSSLAAAA